MDTDFTVIEGLVSEFECGAPIDSVLEFIKLGGTICHRTFGENNAMALFAVASLFNQLLETNGKLSDLLEA